jgi:hypothetical protein
VMIKRKRNKLPKVQIRPVMYSKHFNNKSFYFVSLELDIWY